jgi:adenylate cyclase
LFQQAITLDPEYAEAYAFLGRTYLKEMINQWNADSGILDRIFEYGRQAVKLDETQPTAHETLAFALLAKRDHAAAIAEAREAIRYDPNFADAYVSLGEILCFAGDPEQALPLIERAMRLNPRYTPNYLWALGQTHRLLRNHDEAIRIFKRVVTRNPDLLVAHLMLAACYADTNCLDDAEREVAEVLRISPEFSLDGLRLPYKHQAEIDRQCDSLRRAGLS